MGKRKKATNAAVELPDTVVSASLVERLAVRYRVPAPSFLKTIRRTIFKVKDNEPEFDDMEMASALVLCEQYDLNPFAREIFVTRNRGLLLCIVSIDGFIKIANRQKDFDGVDFAWEEDEDNLDGNDRSTLISCTATIHVKDRSHPVVVTEYLDECKRPTEPWNKWPRRMLRHKAYIQGIRLAFGMSAVDEDEAERMGYRIPDYTVQSVRDDPKPARAKSTRKTPTEVRADPEPEPEPTADAEAPGDTEAPEVVAFKNTLLDELRDHCKNLPEDAVKEIRAAAGCELFNLKCSTAQLETAIRKAEEIVTGARE